MSGHISSVLGSESSTTVDVFDLLVDSAADDGAGFLHVGKFECTSPNRRTAEGTPDFWEQTPA